MARSKTTSSEESDEQEVQTKRSYDCTFCKRGFTNARALGGHMNIHRKERTNYEANQTTHNFMCSSSFVPIVSRQPSTYYCLLEPTRNYDMYIHPSTTNPRNPSPDFQYDFLNTSTESLMETNLSLQIGSSNECNDQVWRGTEKDGEGVNLELRLGHSSYSNY
ncbi:zinc finger protein 11-like [Cicer arietinum]|uniref:Zinc finger protein 11-like n=1 Tax=Cicer arietinum TaxID=3827 RepID=A0A1S2Y2P2_CICAR|nr:zinc finger protein 11-like [Cicer arietinum]